MKNVVFQALNSGVSAEYWTLHELVIRAILVQKNPLFTGLTYTIHISKFIKLHILARCHKLFTRSKTSNTHDIL